MIVHSILFVKLKTIICYMVSNLIFEPPDFGENPNYFWNQIWQFLFCYWNCYIWLWKRIKFLTFVLFNHSLLFCKENKRNSINDTVFQCVKKYQSSELFWSAFFCIRNEYGEIWSISPCLAQMQENAEQNNSKYGHFLRSVFFSKKILRDTTNLELNYLGIN